MVVLIRQYSIAVGNVLETAASPLKLFLQEALLRILISHSLPLLQLLRMHYLYFKSKVFYMEFKRGGGSSVSIDEQNLKCYWDVTH